MKEGMNNLINAPTETNTGKALMPIQQIFLNYEKSNRGSMLLGEAKSEYESLCDLEARAESLIKCFESSFKDWQYMAKDSDLFKMIESLSTLKALRNRGVK